MQNETVGFFNGRSIIEKSVKETSNKSAWINTLYNKLYGNYDRKLLDDDKIDSMQAFKTISLRMGQHFRNNEDIQQMLNENLLTESSAQFLENGDLLDETTITNRHKRSYTNNQLPSLILSPSMMRNESTIFPTKRGDDTMISHEFFTTRPSYAMFQEEILPSLININPYSAAITNDEIKIIDDDPTIKTLATKNKHFVTFNKRVLRLKNQVGLAIEENKTQLFSSYSKRASEKIHNARKQIDSLTKITTKLQEKIRNYKVESETIPYKRPPRDSQNMNMMEYLQGRVSVRTNETVNPSIPQLLETIPELASTQNLEQPIPEIIPEESTADLDKDTGKKTPDLRKTPELGKQSEVKEEIEPPSPIHKVENNEIDLNSITVSKTASPNRTLSNAERVNESMKKLFLTPRPKRAMKKSNSEIKLDFSKSEITVINNLQSQTTKRAEIEPMTFRPDPVEKTERPVKKPALRMDTDISNVDTGAPKTTRIRKIFLPKLPKVTAGSKDQEEFRKIYIKCTNIHENLNNMDKKLFKQSNELTTTFDSMSDKLYKIKRTVFLPQNIVLDGI